MRTLQCILVVWITLGKHNSYNYIYVILWYYISNSSSSELQRTSDHRHQTQAPVVEPDDDVARANREKDWADVPWPMTVNTEWLMVLCERHRWSKSAVYLIQSMFGVYLIYWCILILIWLWYMIYIYIYRQYIQIYTCRWMHVVWIPGFCTRFFRV